MSGVDFKPGAIIETTPIFGKCYEREAILKDLGEPFPPDAIKKRDGGQGRKFDYVDTATVIRRLNHVTAKHGLEWSATVVSTEWKGDLLIETVQLTIEGLGSRCGKGVQKVSERGGEDLAKAGISDALKKAATLFGVALELYGPDYEYGDPAPATPKFADRFTKPSGGQGGWGTDKAPTAEMVREPYNPGAAQRQQSAGQEPQVRPTSQPQPKDTQAAPPAGGRGEFLEVIGSYFAGPVEPEMAGHAYNWLMGRPLGCRDAISGLDWRDAADRAELDMPPLRARFQKVVDGLEKNSEVFREYVTEGTMPEKLYWRLWMSMPGHGGMPKDSGLAEGEGVGE